jgi:galactoside O-acetyltransferase
MQMSKYLKLVCNEARAYLDAVVSALPGASGGKLRALRLRAILASLGPSATISSGIQVLGAEGIHIGPRFFSGRGCSLYADGGGEISIGERVALNADVSLNAAIGGQIHIGNNVLVGPRVLMRATDHAFSRTDVPIWQQGHIPGVIRIEDDVWIGGNVTILGGSTIGKGAVVAAGAVVNNDVPAYAVVGGVPARHLKWRENLPASADVLRKEIEK